MRFGMVVFLVVTFCVCDCFAGEADELDEAEVHRAWHKLADFWKGMTKDFGRHAIGLCVDADLFGIIDPRDAKKFRVAPFKHCGTLYSLRTTDEQDSLSLSVLRGLYVFLPRYCHVFDKDGRKVYRDAIVFGTISSDTIDRFSTWTQEQSGK